MIIIIITIIIIISSTIIITIIIIAIIVIIIFFLIWWADEILKHKVEVALCEAFSFFAKLVLPSNGSFFMTECTLIQLVQYLYPPPPHFRFQFSRVTKQNVPLSCIFLG